MKPTAVSPNPLRKAIRIGSFAFKKQFPRGNSFIGYQLEHIVFSFRPSKFPTAFLGWVREGYSLATKNIPPAYHLINTGIQVDQNKTSSSRMTFLEGAWGKRSQEQTRRACDAGTADISRSVSMRKPSGTGHTMPLQRMVSPRKLLIPCHTPWRRWRPGD